MMEYKDLAVSQQMHKAIERMGFTQMTEIQEKAIPVMLEGREIIAKAPTGTGKTCAFGIPIVEKVEADKPWPGNCVRRFAMTFGTWLILRKASG